MQWQSDGSPKPVICDNANSSSTYTGATCSFKTFDNLQTRAVFADTTAPSMASLTGPNTTVNGAATFTFSAVSDPTLTGFECRVAGVHDWLSCSSGRQENPTASGSYTFQVRAVDASGNRSSESTWGWTVDKTAPETSLEPGVGPAEGSTTSSRSAEFQFNSAESGDLVCTLNGAPVSSGSPKQYDSLPDHASAWSPRATQPATSTPPP